VFDPSSCVASAVFGAPITVFPYKSDPGPTTFGVLAFNIRGDSPASSLLNPKENLLEFGISCLKVGLY
jgi:hypothetical protein